MGSAPASARVGAPSRPLQAAESAGASLVPYPAYLRLLLLQQNSSAPICSPNMLTIIHAQSASEALPGRPALASGRAFARGRFSRGCLGAAGGRC